MGTPRRRAREIALQILYQLDVNPEPGADQALRLYFDSFHSEAADADEDVDDGEVGQFSRDLTETLVRGVVSRGAELDEMLARVSKNWRVERMAQVDRNVMRLALYELNFCDDIPSKVTMNEAIELAKRFGSEEAGAFVNGLLERALSELGIRK